MNAIIKEVRAALQSQADPETLKNGQRFFKESINTYGVKVPVVRQIAKEFSPDKLSKEDAEDQLYVLKEEECKIEKKYRKLYCPEIKRFTEDTQKKTYHFLSLNFS